jgi:hypothetical protein
MTTMALKTPSIVSCVTVSRQCADGTAIPTVFFGDLCMQLPADIHTWLKVLGALTTGIGSILLAWRVKAILKWVVYCLVAHEQSIDQLARIAANQRQSDPIVGGVTKHLLDIESKLGFVLLILGFALLGVGMLTTAASYFVATGL